MKLKLMKLPLKGPCIQMYGSWVSEQVHNAVTRVMTDNWMDSPIYKARIKASAFFQGGSNDPAGKFVLIEFWNLTITEDDEFIRHLQLAVDQAIVEKDTRIEVDVNKISYSKDGLAACILIANDLGCSYDAGSFNRPFTFLPEDTVMHYRVLQHCAEFGIHVIYR